MGISYSYNWLFLWDYTFYKWGLVIVITGYFYGIITFYKWGLVIVITGYFSGIIHSINGD